MNVNILRRMYIFLYVGLYFYVLLYFPCPQEIYLAFLKWLEENVNAEGLIESSKVSLKFVSSCESKMETTPSLMSVITEMGNFSSEHFSLETYQQNLQTKKLGKILLFTEVTTTTMNLLDG